MANNCRYDSGNGRKILWFINSSRLKIIFHSSPAGASQQSTNHMNTTHSLMRELEDAVTSDQPEKRLETLRRITGLFLQKADSLQDQQIAVFDDVLVHLIQRIEAKALVQLSTDLAAVDNAPINVIQHLARNDEIAVAGPVLSQSTRLTELDLIDIAKSKSQGHLLAISGRSSLSESVSDLLAERGNIEVSLVLAGNSGARLSEAGFSRLAKKAEKDEGLAERLGLRLDIPTQLLQQLLLRATDLVRSRLLATASPGNHDQIQRALAMIASEVGREAARPRDFTAAGNLVEKLNREGKLNEKALLGFAQERQNENMTACLALFCRIPAEVIEGAMNHANHAGLVIICKAAGVSWHALVAILKARFSHHSPSEEELDEAKKSFLILSQSAARRVVRFMNVRDMAAKTA